MPEFETKNVRRRFYAREAQEGEGRTKQSDKENCDINIIMARHGRGIPVTHVNGNEAQWGDFSTGPDFRQAQDAVASAKQAFGELPSKIRTRFHNEPGELLQFLTDEDNRAEAEKLGLLKEPEPEAPKMAPIEVSVVNTLPKATEEDAVT